MQRGVKPQLCRSWKITAWHYYTLVAHITIFALYISSSHGALIRSWLAHPFVAFFHMVRITARRDRLEQDGGKRDFEVAKLLRNTLLTTRGMKNKYTYSMAT